jgi:hypothetical protein
MLTYNGVQVHSMADYVYALNIRNGEVAPQLVINVTSEQEKNCKYFSNREVRTEWLESRNKLIDYVISFYGVGEIYASFFGEGVTRDEVMFACNAIDKVGFVGNYLHSASIFIDAADSFSRELVRDYMFCCRGVEDIEHGMVRLWFERNVEMEVVEHQFLVKK